MLQLSRQAKILLRASFLTTFAESMLVPMYAAFAENVGGDLLDAGIAFAVFSIATGLAVGLIGTRDWFQEHIRGFLLFGFSVAAICDVSYIFVRSKWHLFAVQVVAGLATGMIEPAWDALFSGGIESASAKHWSLWAGGTHFVAGLAAIAGGLIVAKFSFTVLFLTMGLVDAMAIIVVWRGGVAVRGIP